MPDEDRQTLEESVRQGGHVLVASVDDGRADEAVAQLEQDGAVDLDERETQWRGGGQPGAATVPGLVTGETAGRPTTAASGVSSGRPTTAATGQFSAPATGLPVTASTAIPGASSGTEDATSISRRGLEGDRLPLSEDGEGTRTRALDRGEGGTIPVIEERLRVGKREVNRGSVRVRSYIVEEPVHEEVRLREEHVSIERRPVNAPARTVMKGSPGDLLQERTIEVSESAEQAVIGKEAHITEEVVVKKTAGERVEQVNDTLRRTEVEVEDSRTSVQPGSQTASGRPEPTTPRR